MIDYYASIKKQFCSTNYPNGAIYEHVYQDFQKELKKRKEDGLGFEGQELHNLGVAMLGALAHLHSKDQSHNDIRPQFMGMTKNGIPVLMDNLRCQFQVDKI